MTAYLSKMDMMAQDRQDKLLNYILMEIGNAVVKEYMLVHGATVMAMITPELINEILTQKIKESIKLTGDK